MPKGLESQGERVTWKQGGARGQKGPFLSGPFFQEVVSVVNTTY